MSILSSPGCAFLVTTETHECLVKELMGSGRELRQASIYTALTACQAELSVKSTDIHPTDRQGN